MGSKLGYRYDYWFCMDNSATPMAICRDDPTIYEFDITTKFYIKGRDEDEDEDEDDNDNDSYKNKILLGSERYTYRVMKKHYKDQIAMVENAVSERMLDYWMSRDEIHTFVVNAIDFVRQGTAPPPRTITVELEVCTVQQPGETAKGVSDRAIRQENLFPLFLGGRDRNFLRSLDVVRVDDDDMKMVMENCPICLQSATIGAQVVMLQDYCNHAFHQHCLVRWLLSNPCCPMCRHPITREESERWRQQRVKYYFKHGTWLLRRDQYLKHACVETQGPGFKPHDHH